MRRSGAALLLLAVSCGGAQAPAPGTATAPFVALPPSVAATPPAAPQPAPAARRAQLHYALNGRPFPLPIVTGTIAGQPVSMLVDSGTNTHVVAGWFARKIGLPMRSEGDSGRDLRGRPIQTSRIDNADISIDGWGPLARGPVLASEVPVVVEQLGIGGFISPQQLVGERGDAVLLDLAKGELRGVRWDETQRELAATGIPLLASGQGRMCEETMGTIKGLAFIIPGLVESQRVELLLSTGAQHSDLFATSAAGKRLASRGVAGGASFTASGRVVSRVIKGAKVEVGSVSRSIDVELMPDAGDTECRRDGLVAMDVLRSCALLLGRGQLFGRCTP